MIVDVILIFARGGGGGSGGGGGGGGGSGGSGGGSGVSGLIVIPLIIGGIIIAWWIRKKRIAKAKALQQQAQASDISWSDDVIKTRVNEVFYAFQKDWSDLNITSMSMYLTKMYHQHISLMLASLKQMNRRNDMQMVELNSVTLFDVNDQQNNEDDAFNVEIKAEAADRLIDLASGKVLYSTNLPFTEIWHFDREDGLWKLNGINQLNYDGLVTKFDPTIDKKYTDFATKNGFFYNADYGWLLMPQHGRLFSDSCFGRSDINHHVIGLYKGVIVQFFEYVPLLKEKATIRDQFKYFYREGRSLVSYTIAQATLPKNYGNIIVERKRTLSFFSFKPRGMTEVKLEWQQFNNMYRVYATDVEKVTSLELLHPAFMEKLGDLKFRINIEIIGSDLYFYTTDTAADYSVMLTLLQNAFEEMKM